MTKEVLFVGLGRMGFPMAGRISKTGKFSVSVHNRSSTKIEQWLDKHEGAALSTDARFDVIILCIGNDEDVRSALLEPVNLMNQAKPGGVIVDHTTTSASLAQEMYAAAGEKRISYIDAPVSGGEAGAIGGTLSCMAGGDAENLSSVMPILQSYCKSITHMGDSGSGQVTKMANQLCIAGAVAGLSEAIKLLEKGNIDTDRALQAIQGGAAQSWQMDNRFATMSKREFDFGFAVDHMIKDLTYALQLAERQQWQPEVSAQVLRCYRLLSEQGHGGHDTSCLLEYYE